MHSQLKCWDFDLNEIEFWIKEGGCLDENGWIDLTMQLSPNVWKGEFKDSGQPPFGLRTLNVFSNYHHYSNCVSQNPCCIGLYYLGRNFKWIQNSWSTVESMDVTARKITFFLITLKPNIRYWWDFLPHLKNLEYEFSTKL